VGNARNVDRLQLLLVVGRKVLGGVTVAVVGSALNGAVLEDAAGYGRGGTGAAGR
jgi:hypothetical protein